MRLRCLVYRQGAEWWGECLELSAVAIADDAETCRNRLHEATTSYLSALADCPPEFVARVSRCQGYWWKRLRWMLMRKPNAWLLCDY